MGMKYFSTIVHTQAALFPKIKSLFELTAVFVLTTTDIFTKLLTFSESSVEINVRLSQTFYVIFLSSAVICKQRFWHGNDIDCGIFLKLKMIWHGDHFRKHLQSSTKFIKKECLEDTQMEKATSNKFLELMESVNMNTQVIDTSNRIFV